MIDRDKTVIGAVLAGDVEAFHHLVDRHRGRLYTFLLRMVADPQLAEELAQTTFVKAYTSLRSFRGDSSFGTWLVQIGIHAARDSIRSRIRRRRRGEMSLDTLIETGGEAAEPADPGPGADAGVEGAEAEASLRRALAAMPADYRLVLVLKHLEDWSFARIADLTGDSVGTLKVRAHRARKMLRDALAETDPAAPDRQPGEES